MAGIVFGCVTPHPPIIVPGVGRGAEKHAAATIEAMHRLAVELARREPETLVIISPHGQYLPHSMGVVTADRLSGSLEAWGGGGREYLFTNDTLFGTALEYEAQTAGIPLASSGGTEYELDHGVMVPMYFLEKEVTRASVVPLTFSWLSLQEHFRFGQVVRLAAKRCGRRVAVVASGDLSHRLLPEAPAGYDPLGKVFDERVVAAVSQMNRDAVLGMDHLLVERAGECGLRSIVILLGALDGLEVKPEVLSYEGPFGVGYLVAAISVQQGRLTPVAVHPLAGLAREAVENYVKHGKIIEPPHEATSPMTDRAGVFVCLKKDGELRGCIGTFEPSKSSVAEETIVNAIGTATRDPRFLPVVAAELNDLEYTVDVLTEPEPVTDERDLDPARYGIIVQSGALRGLLLPDLEGVETVEDQIAICRRKAGIGPEDPVKLFRFEVKRYR